MGPRHTKSCQWDLDQYPAIFFGETMIIVTVLSSQGDRVVACQILRVRC